MKTYLEERIEWYDDNYRNGNALISDKQFDQLEKNLLRTNPNCDYFKKKNKLVLPSLEKDSIDEFLKGLLVDTRLLIEPKIDGCAVALQYRDGILEKAISRKGADVTSKLIKVPDIPNNLSLRGVLQVRGELYAPNQSPNTRYLVGITLKEIFSFLLWAVKYEDRDKWIIDKPTWIPSQKLKPSY